MTKTHAQLAAEAKAATAAALAKLQAAKAELRTATDENDDRSAAMVKGRFLAGDPEVSVLDAIIAERAVGLYEARVAFLDRRVRFLRGRELTMDLSLAEVLAPIVAEILGGITVEATLRLPDRFNTAHAPRVYVVPHGATITDPQSGALSGQVRVHYLRAAAHRSNPLDAHELSIGLDDRGIRLPREGQFRGTTTLNDGAVLLDEVGLEIRYAAPSRFAFAAGHQPARRNVESFAESVAYGAAHATSVVGPRELVGGVGSGSTSDVVRTVGAHKAENISFVIVEEGGVRRTTITADLACVARVLHPDPDSELASRALHAEVAACAGRGVGGIGHVVEARVVQSLGSFDRGGRGGVAVRARFVIESDVSDAEPQEAA